MLYRLLTLLPADLVRGLTLRGSNRDWTDHAGPKQILVDISVLVLEDAGTGIQRAVRALLLQLLAHPPRDCVIKPVFASRTHGYRYAPVRLPSLQGTETERSAAALVRVRTGDIFLGLDLAAHLIPRHQGELLHWKMSGVRFVFLVYDILPVLHREWFNPARFRTFKRWLRSLAILADDVICISRSTRTDLENYFDARYRLARKSVTFQIIPLGADLESTLPSHGIPEDAEIFLKSPATKYSVLLVGTLEPRKGHLQVIEACNYLWSRGCTLNLIIVGRPGWKTEVLQTTIREHPHKGRHLHWFENASDELLLRLYAAATGVLVASFAEGFGLPLVEGLRQGKPVLARDIPVFREIAGDSVAYFSDSTPAGLARTLEAWLSQIQNGSLSTAPPEPAVTWQESSDRLLHCLGLVRNETDHTTPPMIASRR